jgi:hypothetical protein
VALHNRCTHPPENGLSCGQILGEPYQRYTTSEIIQNPSPGGFGIGLVELSRRRRYRGIPEFESFDASVYDRAVLLIWKSSLTPLARFIPSMFNVRVLQKLVRYQSIRISDWVSDHKLKVTSLA